MEKKDPLVCFEKTFCWMKGCFGPEWVPYLRNEFTTLIDAEIEKVFSEPDITPHLQTEVHSHVPLIQCPNILHLTS
jgi:2-oxoisovalerate dehydrogenase E1 component